MIPSSSRNILLLIRTSLARHRSTNRVVTCQRRLSLTPQVEAQNLPGRPIDFAVQARIEGEESHVVTVQLSPGEILRAESGALIYMTEGVIMDTKLAGTSSAFNRFLTGQNLFLTDYRYEGTSTGTVCLGTDFPSKILRFHLQDFPNHALICQRGAFLASNPSVNIEMEFTKSLTSGFFGGQGFVLQKLTGEGDVLVKGGGAIVQRQLKEGEVLRVTSGSIVCFEPTLHYDVQMIPGIKNAMFGGEGLFVTTLTGPGSVWLQGMPPDRMIAEIARRIPGPGIGFGVPIGMGGSGGGDGSSTDGVGEEAATTAGGEEMVAASDAAVNADRQAAVASSGLSDNQIDSESPSALFGDAAAKETSPTTSADEDSFSTSPSRSETTYSDDGFSQESTFQDDISTQDFDEDFASDFEAQDGQLFDDSEPNESFGIESNPPTEEESQSLFGMLWDLFSRGDDE